MRKELLVTGSTGGLGQFIVKKAVWDEEITHVYCEYRNQEKFEKLFPHISSKIVPGTEDAFFSKELCNNKPDELICIMTCFSIEPIGKLGGFSESDIRSNIQVNIENVALLLNKLVGFKNENNMNLRLINIDSGAAYKAIKGWGLYCAAKAYVNMLIKTLCLENPDIKAVSYDPGVMDTQMQQVIRKCDKEQFERVEEFRNYFKQGLLNRPEDVADDIWYKFVKNCSMEKFQVKYGMTE